MGFIRFTPPLCDYSHSPSKWDIQFSSASQLGASTRKWGFQFRLGEVELSFKEFLAPPAMIRLGLLLHSGFKTILDLLYRVVSLMC
jgi:hypothetical protein